LLNDSGERSFPDPIDTMPKTIKERPMIKVIVAKGTAKNGFLYLTEKHPKTAVKVVQRPTTMTGVAYFDS